MTCYKNFIGIDIGKKDFFVAKYSEKQVERYDNTEKGIEQFIKDYASHLKDSLFVLETTGGYEQALLCILCEQPVAVHRANTRHTKHFIYSYGVQAKTDKVDAKLLALYGHERHNRLPLYQPKTLEQRTLEALVRRREELKDMLVAEKNRLQGPTVSEHLKQHYERFIRSLEKECEIIQKEIEG